MHEVGERLNQSVFRGQIHVSSDQADGDNDGVGTACDGMELSVDENGTITDGGTPIPSIGMVGTAVAISAGFFIAIRREDEE